MGGGDEMITTDHVPEAKCSPGAENQFRAAELGIIFKVKGDFPGASQPSHILSIAYKFAHFLLPWHPLFLFMYLFFNAPIVLHALGVQISGSLGK